MSAAALRALHVPGRPLVLPNAWDAGSARLVERAGFAAVATTSSGVAESLGYADGMSAQGLSNQTSFLRPITEGTVHATARRRHKGRTTWVWEVEITDDQDRLCALVRMTIAVRPLPT